MFHNKGLCSENNGLCFHGRGLCFHGGGCFVHGSGRCFHSRGFCSHSGGHFRTEMAVSLKAMAVAGQGEGFAVKGEVAALREIDEIFVAASFSLR